MLFFFFKIVEKIVRKVDGLFHLYGTGTGTKKKSDSSCYEILHSVLQGFCKILFSSDCTASGIPGGGAEPHPAQGRAGEDQGQGPGPEDRQPQQCHRTGSIPFPPVLALSLML